MKQGRFSNEQIVRILRETDQNSVAVVAKRHGVSDATIYIWRKKMLVDRDLEIEVMKEINAKKW